MSSQRHASALVAMDLQVDFLGSGGRLRIASDQVAEVVTGMNRALERAARAGLPIIYVLNAFDPLDPFNAFRNFAAVRGSRGARRDPRIADIPGALILEKKARNAFSNPRLAQALAQHGVDTLVIGGVFADACVLSTCRAALARRFAVDLIGDGVGAASSRARTSALARAQRLGARTVTSSDLFG